MLFYSSECHSHVYEFFSYLQIAQWELLHMKHNFATNIPNFLLKLLKYVLKKLNNQNGLYYEKENKW
jgi:hypothetical protein